MTTYGGNWFPTVSWSMPGTPMPKQWHHCTPYAIAEDLNVEKSGLVKVLLNYALDAIENGDLDVDEYVRLRKRPRKLDI